MNKNDEGYYNEFPNYSLLMRKLSKENTDRVFYHNFVDVLLTGK